MTSTPTQPSPAAQPAPHPVHADPRATPRADHAAWPTDVPTLQLPQWLALPLQPPQPPALAWAESSTVFLLDVDNTLLDNDQIVADLRRHLIRSFGNRSASRYWQIFENLRSELGYADYLGALQRYRADAESTPGGDLRLLHMGSFLLDYPFAQRLFPQALAVLAHLDRQGQTVILSDGDVVFQPRKLQRSGLWDAVDGRAMVCLHKERQLAAVARLYPGAHHVVVDDKLAVLSAMKAQWGERLTTVFVRQGHHARASVLRQTQPGPQRRLPTPDHEIDHIGELLAFDARHWAPRPHPQAGQHPDQHTGQHLSADPAPRPLSPSEHRISGPLHLPSPWPLVLPHGQVPPPAALTLPDAWGPPPGLAPGRRPPSGTAPEGTP